jgi:hypothetical protein
MFWSHAPSSHGKVSRKGPVHGPSQHNRVFFGIAEKQRTGFNQLSYPSSERNLLCINGLSWFEICGQVHGHRASQSHCPSEALTVCAALFIEPVLDIVALALPIGHTSHGFLTWVLMKLVSSSCTSRYHRVSSHHSSQIYIGVYSDIVLAYIFADGEAHNSLWIVYRVVDFLLAMGKVESCPMCSPFGQHRSDCTPLEIKA